MNLLEILIKAPKGTKLYSTIFGEVTFVSCQHNRILVSRHDDIVDAFFYDGKYMKEGECVLFPSKENRDWNTFSICHVKPSYLKFKVGDTIHKEGYPNFKIIAIEGDRYRMKDGFYLKFENQHEWEIKEIKKFDISTLKPFDKVLVRDDDTNNWYCNFYSHYRNNTYYNYGCVSSDFHQCIPYNDETKHLVGTDKYCPEYYKTWE